MDLVMDPVQIQLMKGIKAVFDPLGLLNPGKIWED
jgi:FAD/FMN-containing dehydrogenase